MNDLKLVAAALERSAPDVPLLLATVVRTEGSTYRRPGARALLSEERWLAGGVSGGCVERDLLRRAFHRTAAGPVLVAYDSRAQEDAPWTLALGCNGLVEVLLERVAPDAAIHPVLTPARWIRAGAGGVLVTVVRAPPAIRCGGRLALDPGGAVASTIEQPALRADLERAARAALAERRSALLDLAVEGGTAAAFVEYVPPPQQLVVFGDGYDAPPLCALGASLGWDTTLVSGRRTLAAAAARCDEVVVCHPADVGSKVGIRPGAAAVVMTHNLEHDLAILAAILDSPAGYVGVLGPRHRTDALLARLEEARGPIPATARARVFGPVGLDIGADGPEEVALAIAAEIRAYIAGRRGGHLRDLPGPIHAREAA